MNDHNLDDLIIDNMEPKNSKIKNLLTILTLLIIFLIVGIILAKSYTSGKDNAKLETEKNDASFIAPELKLQPPKKKETFTEPPKERTEPIDMPTEQPKAPETTQKSESTQEIAEETVQITEEYTQKPQSTPQPVQHYEVPPKVEAKKPISKKVVKKQPTYTKPQKAVRPHPVERRDLDTYYVQVGSFQGNPSRHILSVIKNSGFHYTIQQTSQGVKKLLIGPYQGRASVDRALTQVRDRINKTAFVVKK